MFQYLMNVFSVNPAS